MQNYQRLQVVTNLDVDETATADVARNCVLKGFIANNKNAATLYLKIYNKATAATVGSDTPILTIGIPPTVTGGLTQIKLEEGVAFSAGISLGGTTAAAVADTGAPGAGDMNISLFFE